MPLLNPQQFQLIGVVRAGPGGYRIQPRPFLFGQPVKVDGAICAVFLRVGVAIRRTATGVALGVLLAPAVLVAGLPAALALYGILPPVDLLPVANRAVGHAQRGRKLFEADLLARPPPLDVLSLGGVALVVPLRHPASLLHPVSRIRAKEKAPRHNAVELRLLFTVPIIPGKVYHSVSF